MSGGHEGDRQPARDDAWCGGVKAERSWVEQHQQYPEQTREYYQNERRSSRLGRTHLKEPTQRGCFPDAVQRLLDAGHRARARAFGYAKCPNQEIRSRIAAVDVRGGIGKRLSQPHRASGRFEDPSTGALGKRGHRRRTC
jgi:hypothetical protein